MELSFTPPRDTWNIKQEIRTTAYEKQIKITITEKHNYEKQMNFHHIKLLQNYREPQLINNQTTISRFLFSDQTNLFDVISYEANTYEWK